MQFEHEFFLPVGIDHAWAVLTDIERIAPCMPGAQLEEIAGDSYKGSVKIRVGPITAQYRGTATMIEKDAAAKRMVLDGKGADSFGQGNASAIATGLLFDEGARTRVTLTTEVQISGKIAQLGQGVMKDVSGRLLKQFVSNLEKQLEGDSPAAPTSAVSEALSMAPVFAVGTGGHRSDGEAIASPAATAPHVRRIESAEAEAIDVLAIGGGAVLRRYGLAIAAVTAALAIGAYSSYSLGVARAKRFD